MAALAGTPWVVARPLTGDALATYRRRAIFDCCKWDPQVEDVATLSPVPLLLRASAWQEVSALAGRLAAETAALEEELVSRPDLHGELGLPRRVRSALAEAARGGASRGVARLLRFDFHWTTDGWRVSEVNADVPGGLNEASGLPPLMAVHHPETRAVGDPAAALCSALRAVAGDGAPIALLHATSYSDDRQVMEYLARRLAPSVSPVLASPAHLRWNGPHARLACDWSRDVPAAMVRFFPAEWLPELPSAAGWRRLFAGAATPACNPATALLVQSKRLPLVWNDLKTRAATWRTLLPETRDPREVGPVPDAWVLKPALGRVGEDVSIAGVTSQRDQARIARAARWRPSRWIAQRRFRSLGLPVEGATAYPCLGVYTVDGRVAGAYGRLALRPLVDGKAMDAPVLIVEGSST